MGIGFSLLLLAVGAILTFAVHTHVEHFDLITIGEILIFVGAAGLVLSLVASFGWHRDNTVIHHDHDHFLD